MSKDFRSVSPSAKSLLLLKGYTNIPYASETAALMQDGQEAFGLDFSNKDFWFWIRVMHFEARYWSIDQLLHCAGARHVLELSSGYSLRGLHLCRQYSDVQYIDTDLPEIIDTKTRLLQQLCPTDITEGRLQMLPL
ncbi:MAG: hypothetical protein EBZ77_07165 [Chitinophagia bacterium]|nr:hypothetical protein [Chitinophagia bacterium]